MSLEEKEKHARELIEQNRKDDAVKLLFELIVSHADSQNFDKADELRQTLLDTAPMALTEIINSGEIIDDRKSKGIDPGFKQIWASFFDAFSPEEANGFYYSLTTIKVPPGKTIIRQGKLNDKLFFINSGRLKVICRSGADEIVVKEMGPRDISGMSSFFAISLATTTVMTTTPVSLSYLTRKALNDLKEALPGFDTRLMELCSKTVPADTSQIIRRQETDRRQYKRFPAEGKVALFIVNAEGKPISKQIYAVLEDLSIGGAAFIIKSSNKETARALLGRNAMIKLISARGDDVPKETKKGKITGLQDQLFNNYSISFQFLKPLTPDILSRFIKDDSYI